MWSITSSTILSLKSERTCKPLWNASRRIHKRSSIGYALDWSQENLPKISSSTYIDELSYDEVTSNDFIINPVQTKDDLNIWRDIAIAVNGPAFVPLADTYVRVGIGNQLHSYIGWIEDVPVAISSIFYGTYAAGVYNISTLPAYRGRGLGRAITLRGLQDAKENKYEVAVLTSTEMGLPVYNRIGFKPCTTMSVYKHMQSIANS
jgi:GNAT superfamily N-acetyltransferase